MPRHTPANLDLRVANATALTADERAGIVALCDAAFGEPFAHLFDEFPGSVHVLGVREGAIVSHAAWVTRWLQAGDRPPLRTAYVEAVATEPARQRRGYATAVMRELQRRIADFDLGALSPSDPAFYAPLGWEAWRGPLAIRTGDGLLPTPDEGVMILRLPRTPPLALDARLTAEWRRGELW